MKRAIYPGSFDPVTKGHLDIIARSSRLVDELIVGVLNNRAKNSLFFTDERVSMLEELTSEFKNVTVGSAGRLCQAYGCCYCDTGAAGGDGF